MEFILVQEISLIQYLNRSSIFIEINSKFRHNIQNVSLLGVCVWMRNIANMYNNVCRYDLFKRCESGISVVGRSETNPTVSDKITERPDGNLTSLMVGSSVANNGSSAKTFASVSLLNNVDLPALVYPPEQQSGTGPAAIFRCNSRVRVTVLSSRRILNNPHKNHAPVSLDLGLAGSPKETEPPRCRSDASMSGLSASLII